MLWEIEDCSEDFQIVPQDTELHCSIVKLLFKAQDYTLYLQKGFSVQPAGALGFEDQWVLWYHFPNSKNAHRERFPYQKVWVCSHTIPQVYNRVYNICL